MFLLLNTSARDQINLTLFGAHLVEQKMYPVPNRELLATVNAFLEEQKITIDKIQGIAVVVGVGGFTSTRIATTVGNLWSWSEQIPIIGVSLAESEDLSGLAERLAGTEPGKLILAEYSGEPNLGQKK